MCDDALSRTGSRTGLLRLLIVAGVLVLAMTMSGCETMFVYNPVHESEDTLLRIAATRGLEAWPEARRPTGEIEAWYARAPGDGARRGRLLVFNGNGGYALGRVYFVRGFHSVADLFAWDVYLFEYPGYGSRSGRPSEEALVEAAVSAAERLVAEEPDVPLYLLGESLGSGVAAQVASRMPDSVAGVVLVTSFTNIVDVGASVAPRFLVQLVIGDRYDSEAALAEYNGPVAFRLAGRDTVVPTSLGRELYDGYHGPRRLRVDESAGHNTLDYDPSHPWWREVTEFLLEHTGN